MNIDTESKTYNRWFKLLCHINIMGVKGNKSFVSLVQFLVFALGCGCFSSSSLALSVVHDMNAPLSHYFIFTGHNSYLTGNQLTSDCSDVLIIKALKKGVRVIELDIWPNSDKDDVHVLHGSFFDDNTICISLGLTVAAVSAILSDRDIVGLILFTLALNHKQVRVLLRHFA